MATCCTCGCYGCNLDPFATYHATFYNDFDGSCPCLDGLIIPMTFDPVTQSLGGSATICNDNGCVVELNILCSSTSITATCLSCNSSGVNGVCAVNTASVDFGSFTCAPLHMSFFMTWNDLPGNQCGPGHICCGGTNASFHIVLSA